MRWKMLLAHKIELRPTAAQADYLSRACGSRRHCYNQLLAHFKQDGVKWSKKAAYQHYIQVIRPEFAWYGEVSSRATRNAIDDLDSAFKHFFRRIKNGEKPGFPRFKRKDINDSFALRERAKFGIEGRKLRIEKLKANLHKLAKLQRNLKKKQKGSNRRQAAKLKVAKLHARISNQRKAVLHEVSDHVTAHFDTVVIEDLNVKGMVKNHCLARAVSDAGFGTLRRMIEYKSELRSGSFVVASRWLPSSKACSECGQLHDMPLSERTMKCDCGNTMDRDLNAATNLMKYGEDRLQPTEKRTQESNKTVGLPTALAVMA